MSKSLLFRLLRIGAIPKKLRPVLEAERIVFEDEGMREWLISKNVKGPGKRAINRSEGFTGCLAETEKRIVCLTYQKRQMNISLNDPKVAEIGIGLLKAGYP